MHLSPTRKWLAVEHNRVEFGVVGSCNMYMGYLHGVCAILTLMVKQRTQAEYKKLDQLNPLVRMAARQVCR